ncbi:amino acid ABC transporter permease [Candidatus Thioglobus autotrophicus]|uniref:amino acid ABC transporter permease n=1 Tax=Candidatus Thioglobus autotrophicus TaxID=1705394 RepID=UPI00299F08F2|nr:amino acid ABC transporter permease [Candidatus Thioglobus autotrophicus]WPE17307.1 amino acid ABC transporter permease [Candidatus Thioglobus autotrophicus]
MAIYSLKETKQPPKSQTKAILWLKDNLFSSTLNVSLTFVALYILYLLLPPILNWTIFDANFDLTADNQSCGREGACWSFINANLKMFIYGFYPQEELWRVNTMFGLVAALVVFGSLIRNSQYRAHYIIGSFLIYPVVAFFLLYGGLGLEVVETDKWGGLTLTVVVAAVGIVASFPLGILFALGRQSEMRVVKFISVVYIEFVRGVPLITILFMASVVLPLFFSAGMDFDKLLRALIGITLFQTAYIAEVIRGGLQAIPRGQYEAADAAGLSFMQKTMLVILPQALKVSIPNIVGSFIALFKDTTLLLIIGLFDMLAIVGAATSNSDWLGRDTEGYVFVAMVIWVILYSMSRYSKRLEVRFSTEHK